MWSLPALVREAIANIGADRWRSAMVIAINAVLIGGLATLELNSTAALWTEAIKRHQAGISVVIVSSEIGLPASTCDAFNARSDVRSAGGWRDTGIIKLATAPSTRFPTAVATAGLLAVWDPTITPRQGAPTTTALGEALAKELRARPGTVIAPARQQPVTIDAVYDGTNRSALYARWLVTSTPAIGSIAECWIEFEPGYEQAGAQLASAAFSTPTNEITLRPLLDLGGHARSLSDDYNQRPARALLPFAVALAVALAALMTWFRRAELALYRAVGTSRVQLLLLAQTETILLLSVGGALGALCALSASRWTRAAAAIPVPYDIGIPTLARTVAIAIAVLAALVPLAGIMVRTDISRDLKDR